MRSFIFCLITFMSSVTHSAHPVVNVYGWEGEIPNSLIQQFERETGIQVHFSSYDSNETLFAKLKASRKPLYDVIMPSSYYVERMRKQGMLMALDAAQLPNLHHLDPLFAHNSYDPQNHYSIPLVWGITGIFYNNYWVKNPPMRWKDLWRASWRHQLLFLDDVRELFSIALLSLGYQPNDDNPTHLKQAFNALKKLAPNIKLFASDGVQAIIIDEDAIAGAIWNGDAIKGQAENRAIRFVYPEEGFIIWVDCLAILKDAPHQKEAYRFINFLLNPSSAKQISLEEGFAITNQAGKQLLPAVIRDNPIMYPAKNILKRGYFQRDLSDETIALYNDYWEQLKLSF